MSFRKNDQTDKNKKPPEQLSLLNSGNNSKNNSTDYLARLEKAARSRKFDPSLWRKK